MNLSSHRQPASPRLGGKSGAALCGLLCALLAGAASAQPAPPGPDRLPPPPQAAGPLGAPLPPTAAPQQIEARVSSYLLSPEAEVAGLLLDNGWQVRMPPHLGSGLAALVKPGEAVRIVGQAEAGNSLRADSVTAVASGRALSDTPPAPGLPPVPPPARAGTLEPMKAQGTVSRLLSGPRGEPDGLILSTGLQVQLPRHAVYSAAAYLAPGAQLIVEGYGRRSEWGSVLQATSLAKPGEAPTALYSSAAPVPPLAPPPPRP